MVTREHGPPGDDMDFRPIDADNHYYEPLDAFTRHLEREYSERGVRVMQEGKRTQLVVGGRLNRFVPNPTFDPIVVAGCIDPFFRGQVPDGVDPRTMIRVEPLRPEYQDRDARVAVIEEQGLDAVVMFPTLACGMEQALKDDVPALMATLSAFNRWLDDDWGYSYRDRILTAGMLCLADPDAALVELEWLLDHGARAVHIRPAPVPGPNGTTRSLGDELHDPIWARLAEASVPAMFHLGDSGYNAFAAAWGAVGTFEGYGKHDVLSRVLVADRAIHDTMATLLLHGVFTRHPNLKVASIENGSDWLRTLVKRLRKQANQHPHSFDEDPLDTIRRHIWVTPYYEEDVEALADLIGIDRIMFGSDWPHGEGLADPLSFEEILAPFDEDARHRVMRDNCLELLGTSRA